MIKIHHENGSEEAEESEWRELRPESCSEYAKIGKDRYKPERSPAFRPLCVRDLSWKFGWQIPPDCWILRGFGVWGDCDGLWISPEWSKLPEHWAGLFGWDIHPSTGCGSSQYSHFLTAASAIDVDCLEVMFLEPFPHFLGDKLWAIVGAVEQKFSAPGVVLTLSLCGQSSGDVVVRWMVVRERIMSELVGVKHCDRSSGLDLCPF